MGGRVVRDYAGPERGAPLCVIAGEKVMMSRPSLGEARPAGGLGLGGGVGRKSGTPKARRARSGSGL